MNAILKGILVVLVTICLFAVFKAKAGTKEEFLQILSDKRVVYNGVCLFDKDGKLTFKHDEKKTVKPCVVGFEMTSTTKHYLVLYDHHGVAHEILLFNEEDKSQVRLWARGTEI